jgi:hypothetical protein
VSVVVDLRSCMAFLWVGQVGGVGEWRSHNWDVLVVETTSCLLRFFRHLHVVYFKVLVYILAKQDGCSSMMIEKQIEVNKIVILEAASLSRDIEHLWKNCNLEESVLLGNPGDAASIAKSLPSTSPLSCSQRVIATMLAHFSSIPSARNPGPGKRWVRARIFGVSTTIYINYI